MSDKYLSTPVGFARVNKEPLDKYKKFESVKDAIEYAKNGPSYSGQIISVSLDDANPNINGSLLLCVNNNSLSIIGSDSQLGSFEPYIKTYNDKKYMLVYYNYNSLFESKYEALLSFLPCKFSILEAVELFRDSSNKFNFLLENSSGSFTWSQNANPINGDMGNDNEKINDGETINELLASDNGEYYFVTNNSIGICPISTAIDTDIELYICIDDYNGIH